MMQLRYLILPIIFAILFPVSAMSDEPIESTVRFSHLLENDIHINEDIKEALTDLENGISMKNHRDILKSIRTLEIIRLNLRTEELPFVAEYLRRRGEFLVSRGESSIGIKLMEEAISAFPRYSPIHFDLARIYLSKEHLDIKKGIVNLIDGVIAYSSLRSRKERLISYTALILTIISMLSFFIYLPILLLGHSKRLHRDIKKILHLPEESLLSNLIALLVILFPLVTGGLFPFLISIPVFVWGYQKGIGERVVLVCSIIFLLLFYPVIQSITWSLTKPENSLVQELERFSVHIWDAKTFTVFKDRLKRQPEDYFLNAAVGLMYKRMDKKDIALRSFQDQLEIYPDDPYLLVNIGDIRLISGENEEAIRLYRQVINIAPDNVEARYNLSTALMNKFEMDKANEEYKKAYNLNSPGIDRHLDLVKKGLDRPMDAIPNMGSYSDELRNAAIADRKDESLYDLFLFPFGLQGKYMTIPFIFLIVIGFRWLINRRWISDQCRSCGSLLEEGAKCTMCSALRLSPDRLDPKMRNEGICKVNRYKKATGRMRLLLNILLPGTGIVLKDHNVQGFAVIISSVCFIAFIVSIIHFKFAPVLMGGFITLYLFFNFMTNLALLKMR
ncbi:MAG: tetratricopeptide repeat protein [Thermodesulfobacteriota bacterium]